MIDYEKYPIYKTSTEILKLVSEKTKNFQSAFGEQHQAATRRCCWQ
jgi:hypothetical protein